ncbi:MAG: formate hydrogenlyase maturation HycH family protein [Paludibacterium sp.]|uniref:formate hydrogenlyase maturation HycH family protein n=1 Tax=Paludibacterium sp. TaxID=1917523 RepID=UPI0025DEEF47|nr:formate hydrogenlyase maturation HycH family protein [Paludibacterium sp.]MBV8047105.1 formate hydrogenlyase maturation HycH family protein [Paludibacterium sp.]MBV8648810.1 formate hydrogenlyase maturation HycH family protein [Paludibacterium sp.]
MDGKVVFYSLSKKFLEREQDLPPEGAARQVIYQTLALGHHIGVIDCLKPLLSCPQDGFERWIAQLPDGEARRKLGGVLKFGEIMIDASHIGMLGAALSGARAAFSAEEDGWCQQLMRALAAISREPAMYLMVKRHGD